MTALKLEDQSLVDESWILSRYSELEGFFVSLDPNPMELGPTHLSAKVEKVRRFQNAVEGMFQQATRDMSILQNLKNQHEGIYNLQRDELLTNDLTVRAGRSASDRLAMVNVKLRPILEKIEHFRQQELMLRSFLEVVERRISSLHQTNQQIGVQVRLMEKEWVLAGTKVSGLLPTPSQSDMDFFSLVEDEEDSTTPQSVYDSDLDEAEPEVVATFIERLDALIAEGAGA